MNRGFELVECIYHKGERIIIYKDDYPFCDEALITVEQGLDSSTIPSEEFRRVRDILDDTLAHNQKAEEKG